MVTRLTGVERWIVVGGGAAGCVVARRMSDDPGRDVILVEAGPRFEPIDVTEAIAGPDHLRVDADDRWRVHRLDGPAGDVYRTGAGVGGSSVVNGMVALRGDAIQYESWGWGDCAAAWRSVLLPESPANDDELGPVDRALLAADPRTRRVPLTRRDGRRVTSAEAYLWPAAGRANLRIMPQHEARTVRSDPSAGVEVEFVGGARVDGSHVVLCAGAIDTAALVLRSGLGGPAVGSRLEDHPTAVVDLALRDRADGGLVSGAMVEEGDIQVLAMNHVGDGERGAALLVTLMNPAGSGRVELQDDDVVVTHPGVSHPDDRRRLADGVRWAEALLHTPPFAAIVEGTASLLPREPDDLSDWLTRQPIVSRHASSTCAMGEVVDENGRLFRDGTALSADDRIRLCDASVFPSVPHTNPHLPVTMLAERLTAMWRTRSS